MPVGGVSARRASSRSWLGSSNPGEPGVLALLAGGAELTFARIEPRNLTDVTPYRRYQPHPTRSDNAQLTVPLNCHTALLR